MRFGRAGLLALLLACISSAFGAGPGQGNVDGKRIRAADRQPGNWMTWGRTYDEQRFSPLKQIDARNVNRLGLAWYADLDTFRGVEATPIVVDGVLYNTSAWNITTAYDAKTGRVLWTHDPKVPRAVGRLACCDIVSRGLAVWKGKVIIATLDGRLVALEAATGKEIWSTQTLDIPGDWPYTVTGAPRVFDDKVLIGNAGAEMGVRGYVTAYDANSGRKLWRFFTVPGGPGPFENKAMEMAARTWTGEWWKAGGGGTVWDSIAYDPQLRLIYIGVGNGSPWAQRWRSPAGGDNLFLASIVALKADNGEYVWHYQTTPGEQWDYTATQHMILADLKIRGRTRQVIMQAPKNGFFYVLDRRTGELLSADPFLPITWASHVDMKTGRPVEMPEARYGETPVLLSPHPGGGHNFSPMSYSPLTGLVYFPVVRTFGLYAAAETYAPRSGTTGINYGGFAEERKRLSAYGTANSHAWLTAWDPVARKEVWRVPRSRDGSGGVLATAGNLLIQGTIDRTVVIHRADTGEKLWEMPVQTVPIAGPISYSVDGEQYIALNAGWGGGLAHVELASGKGLHVSSARLLAFKLGGTAQLPPLRDAPPLSPPPRIRTTDAQLRLGEQLYTQHCVMCHGPQVRGGLKDLRYMTAATRAEFYDIVLGGKRADKGMIGFSDRLTQEEARAIDAYVTIRALEDWGESR